MKVLQQCKCIVDLEYRKNFYDMMVEYNISFPAKCAQCGEVLNPEEVSLQ